MTVIFTKDTTEKTLKKKGFLVVLLLTWVISLFCTFIKLLLLASMADGYDARLGAPILAYQYMYIICYDTYAIPLSQLNLTGGKPWYFSSFSFIGVISSFNFWSSCNQINQISAKNSAWKNMEYNQLSSPIIAPDKWEYPDNIFLISPWKHVVMLIRSASVRRF